MYAVFGVEPKSINNWKDLRYIVEKFGFSNGLLIARYPKRWMAMVMEACRDNGVKDIELSKIEEKLRQIKTDRFLKVGLPYTENDWCESIACEGVINNFNGVITREYVQPPLFYSVDDVAEGVFLDHREAQVKRNAVDLASVARNLLISSNELTLIDPYFQPKPKCVKVLKQLILNSINDGKGIKKVTVYTAYSTYSVSTESLKNEFEKEIFNIGDISLKVIRVYDEVIDFDFHARYLLTDKAGLRYDRGFVEPYNLDEKNHLTDVVCLDTKTYKSLIMKYSDDRTNFIDKVVVASHG